VGTESFWIEAHLIDACVSAFANVRTGLAPKLSIPNVWVEELWGWSDRQLAPR